MLTKARRSSWRYMLLNRADEPLFELDGVMGGDYEIVAQSPLGVSGSITLKNTGQPINFMRDRVQIIYDPGNGVEAWPVATMRLTSPKDEHAPRGVTWNISLLSKLSVLSGDTVERYSLPAGTPIISTVESLIRSANETRIAVTPSSATLSSPLTFDPGTSKLSIINELLQAAGYFSLWVDGGGQFRVQPYVDPGRRPVAHTFAANETSIHLPTWSREQDLTGVPNRVKVMTEGDDETLGLVGVATNENPDSQFSYQSRGGWFDREIETVEASSQAVVNSIAAQRLRDAMDPVARYEVSHWMWPLDPNDLVVFAPSSAAPVTATVQRMSVTCDAEAMVQATWREVLPL